ncbi:hypothetical protein E4U59_006541 [Claviceps monticola]|nr:hypothetical protein E4U59_006541 [Claviceps monticola]
MSGDPRTDFPAVRVTSLEKKFSPGDYILKASLPSQYKALLQDALRANTNPDRWLDAWATLYPRASPVKIPELEGPNAVRDFLSAVGNRFEPSWAHSKDVELTKYTDELPEDMSLLRLHDELRRFREGRRVNQASVGIGVHATLGAQSDEPEDCNTLRQAVTGDHNDNGYKSSITQTRRTAIRQSYESPKWEALRSSITANGWQSSKKKRWNKPKGKIPSNIAAAAIDPDLLQGVVAAEAQAVGIYITLGDRRHILSESTVYDTGGAMHVVNSIGLLDPGTFRPAEDEYIEAGNTDFHVVGRGTRVLKKIFRGDNGVKNVDLKLLNVAVVEGFHVNIVSASRLEEKGIWDIGSDHSLRFGDPKENLIVTNLVKMHHLLFLEYKPLYNYSPLSLNLTLVTRPMVFSTQEHTHTHTREP